jgi:hypothetical protein
MFLASAVEGHGRAQPARKRRIFLRLELAWRRARIDERKALFSSADLDEVRVALPSAYFKKLRQDFTDQLLLAEAPNNPAFDRNPPSPRVRARKMIRLAMAPDQPLNVIESAVRRRRDDRAVHAVRIVLPLPIWLQGRGKAAAGGLRRRLFMRRCERRGRGVDQRDNRAAVTVARRSEIAGDVQAQQLGVRAVDAVGDRKALVAGGLGGTDLVPVSLLGRRRCEGNVRKVDVVAQLDPGNRLPAARPAVEQRCAAA